MRKKLLLKINEICYKVYSKINILRMTDEEKQRLKLVALVIQ